jgi:hypothetical protein
VIKVMFSACANFHVVRTGVLIALDIVIFRLA